MLATLGLQQLADLFRHLPASVRLEIPPTSPRNSAMTSFTSICWHRVRKIGCPRDVSRRWVTP